MPKATRFPWYADADGWFHTGDVAEFTPAGALRIVDRLKNFFKLAHGEYVAAERLENTYKKVTLVDQIWVYGDSERAQLVAIVVPSHGGLTAWAESNGASSDFEVRHPLAIVPAAVSVLMAIAVVFNGALISWAESNGASSDFD